MDHIEYAVVCVTLEDRDDGGLLVYSDDLPGLILSGPDKHAVCGCIAPAIQALFEHKGLGPVSGVHSAKPLSEVLRLRSPRNVDMHVQQFVVEFKQAA